MSFVEVQRSSKLSNYLSTIFCFASNPLVQGCNNDKGSASACGSKDKYNFGWRDPTAEFRSIMANDCSTGQCDKMPKNGCYRVQRFSSEQQMYNGIQTGSPEHNNARHLNEVSSEVAAYLVAIPEIIDMVRCVNREQKNNNVNNFSQQPIHFLNSQIMKTQKGEKIGNRKK